MSYPNPEQQAVLDHRRGALLVLAPAGTGKTRVMADRLAAAIRGGIPARDTLAVTFTNRAAGEMRRAVARSCSDAARDCRIQTFHGLCAWILRTDARDLGLPVDFVIYDDQDSIDLLRITLRNSNVKAEEAFWTLTQLKSDCPQGRLTLAEIPEFETRGLADAIVAGLRDYHQRLAERHALDFADLVYRTRAMFARLEDKRQKWAGRFCWIQIDEVQDTHMSEYEVIRLLATPPADIAFFGDLDQTIYEWRGSSPEEVLEQLATDFAPLTTLPLVHNYRSTKSLLRAADRHAATFATRRTANLPAPTLPEGDAPVIYQAADTWEEATWIAGQMQRVLAQPDTGRVGVLARTHKRTAAVSEALTAHGIPHLTVEQFEFFRRQEIKDLLARLRLLLNPSDSGSLLRLTQRPASGIGPAALHDLWDGGRDCALRITDLADPRNHSAEPFQHLLAALDRGSIVVFDVETTGLSPETDEVIDLGAVKLTAGRPAERFEALLRPTRPPGESAAVHGLDDHTLQRDGRDPATVFREFAEFIGDAVLVGHNIRFDLAMVRAHAGRLGVPVRLDPWSDTLEIARRLLALERYDLATVCNHLRTSARPSHRALADAAATSEVLLQLAPGLRQGSAARTSLINRHRDRFVPIAESFARWRNLTDTTRPPDLCRTILDESRLLAHYHDDPRRLTNLAQFAEFFQQHDDPRLPPAEALAELTRHVALARNLDHLDPADARVPVLTVHQSKGLEFDCVFIAGVTDDEFPGYYAKREGRVEEEKRLFYVALTRARRRLFISCHDLSDTGWHKGPSPFLRNLR